MERETPNCVMLVADMRDAKRLSSLTWDGLLPSERQRALSLLGTYYRAYDKLATYTAFANGHIEQLREALGSLLPGLVLDLRYADMDDDKDAMRSRIRTVQEALSIRTSQHSATVPHE